MNTFMYNPTFFPRVLSIFFQAFNDGIYKFLRRTTSLTYIFHISCVTQYQTITSLAFYTNNRIAVRLITLHVERIAQPLALKNLKT